MLVDFLKAELESRSRKNPKYSIRSFARSLSLDSSTLSAILRGKRIVSAKTAKKILEQLEIDEATRSRLLLSTVDVGEKPQDTYLLDNEKLEIVAGWEHFAIMSVLELTGFVGTVSKIAHRLNLPTITVMNALQRLEKVGLAYHEKGRWYSTGKQIVTTSGIPSSALRRANREYIEKALYSLEHHPISERDVTGVTMAISKKKFPKAQRLIRDFRASLCRLLEEGVRDEVYRLNIQLFPLKK